MRQSFFLLFICCFVFVFERFVAENPYFVITQKDIVLSYPKTFPKPVYDINANKITPDGFMLGRKLFYDPNLSKDYFISCASCHQQFAAFAHVDHQLAHGIYGKIGKRNAPALQNLIWQKSFMHDGGINHLDLQPIAPITSPVEMDETMANILDKLKKDSVYRFMFFKAYGDSMITTKKVLQAFSQFMALMVSSNSKYDKYLNGTVSFDNSEANGLKLFRRFCNGCHTEPLFTNNHFEINGLPIDSDLLDSGRIKVTGMKEDFLKFKVPSLRNVQLTYPYMHDGRIKHLKEVISFYHNNALSATDKRLKHIHLTSKEQSDLLSFLLTLTDSDFTHDRRFMDPNTTN